MDWDAASFSGRYLIQLYALTAALACGFFFICRRSWTPLRDILAALLALLVWGCLNTTLDFYQESEPSWRLHLLWLLACTPFLAASTRSRAMAAAWAIAVLNVYSRAPEFASWIFPAALADDMQIISAFWPVALILALAGYCLNRLGPERKAQADAIWASLIALLLLTGTFPILGIFTGFAQYTNLTSFLLDATSTLITILLIALLRRASLGKTINATSILAVSALIAWGLCLLFYFVSGGIEYTGIPVAAFWILAASQAYLARKETWFFLSCLTCVILIVTLLFFSFPTTMHQGILQAIALGGLVAFSILVWELTERAAARQLPR